MEAKPFLLDENTYKVLQKYYDEHGQTINIRRMFNDDAERFDKYSAILSTPGDGDILIDYSKNRINDEVLKLLFDLARARDVEGFRDVMYSGGKINFTLERAVLFVALRNRSNRPMRVDGIDVMPAVNAVLVRLKDFCHKVISGDWKGFSGKRITNVVNIGIGGANLGSQFATEALQPYSVGPQIHFVSNIDGSDLATTLKVLDPETTLFVITSKTFSSQETITNAESAKEWLNQSSGDESALAKHFVTATANASKAKAFGIVEENIFEFWDWVGGRFSLWSSSGLPVALSIGFDNFENLLAGAHFMDEHFRNMPLEKNIPVILAIIGIWHHNFYGAKAHALLPYDHFLKKIVGYFQQGDMESSGKNVTRSGRRVEYSTGPIIWGGLGTENQHTFYQMIYQGTHLLPADFIATVKSHYPIGDNVHHKRLLANFLAQSEAFMKGRSEAEVKTAIERENLSTDKVQQILPHRIMEGNQPSNSIIAEKMSPYTLGVLIAMYEHKIVTQGVIWDINSFDEWGVAMGKELPGAIEKDLESTSTISSHDSSTKGILDFIKTRL